VNAPNYRASEHEGKKKKWRELKRETDKYASIVKGFNTPISN